jgi:hypothetical protein
MPQLLLPPSARPAQPAMKPGVQLAFGQDGANVWIQCTSTVVLAPEQALQFAEQLKAACEAAAQFREAVLNPAPVIANGHV